LLWTFSKICVELSRSIRSCKIRYLMLLRLMGVTVTTHQLWASPLCRRPSRLEPGLLGPTLPLLSSPSLPPPSLLAHTNTRAHLISTYYCVSTTVQSTTTVSFSFSAINNIHTYYSSITSFWLFFNLYFKLFLFIYISWKLIDGSNFFFLYYQTLTEFGSN